MTDNHTPTPYQVAGYHKEIDTEGPNWVGIGNGRVAIAHVLDTQLQDAEATAAFIVRAVNAHEDLLAACRKAAEWMDENSVVGKKQNEIYHLLRDVIAKAEGRP